MFVTPGVVVDGKLVTNDLVDINLGMRILLGSSFYDDWKEEETLRPHDPLGNPVDQRHPWNQTTLPRPQKRDFEGGNYSWVMSPRWQDPDSGEMLPLETGGGPLARLWATALAGLVDTPYVKATGGSIESSSPRARILPETEFEWKVPQWCNTIERDRARIYFIAYSAAMALLLHRQGAWRRSAPGTPRPSRTSRCRTKRSGCGFHEAVRGVLSHHLVIRDGKIANYHPYPAHLLERQPDRQRRHTGTDGRGGTAIPRSSRKTARTASRGSTSCAPCAASIPACRAACTCISAAGG